MLVYIYTRDLPLRLRGGELSYLRPTPSVLKIMFRKGLPIGIQMIVVSSSMLTMMTMVNRLGVDTTAAFGATQQLWTYVQMPAMALGAAVSAMAAPITTSTTWISPPTGSSATPRSMTRQPRATSRRKTRSE